MYEECVTVNCNGVVLFGVQKEEVQRIEQMNADCCLQIQELEHCISSRALSSCQLQNT